MNFIFINYLILNIIFFLFFNKFSKKINIYDFPNHRKLHKDKVSLAGGIFVFISIYFYLFYLAIFDPSYSKKIFFLTTQHFTFFLISFFFFIIGLFDDKNNLSANKKISIFLILILFAVSIDTELQVQILYFSFFEKNILLENFKLIFTIFSIFIFINALNMYDGSNCQLGNYVLFFILYLSFKSQSSFILSFVIPIVFFIYLNMRNLTFMGNSGTYFLGFFLSFIIIKIYNNGFGILTCDEIFLLMFYPVIDLARLFFFRIFRNKNPLTGDRNHIHHILESKYKSNLKVQTILITLTIVPLLLHEFLDFNNLYLMVVNIIVYLLLLRNNLFSYNYKE